MNQRALRARTDFFSPSFTFGFHTLNIYEQQVILDRSIVDETHVKPDLAFECSFMYNASSSGRHESHRSIMALNVHFFGGRLLSTRNCQQHFVS